MSESALPINSIPPSTHAAATWDFPRTWDALRPDLQVQSGRLVAGVTDFDDRMGHSFWWQASSSKLEPLTDAALAGETPIRVMISCEGTPLDVWPSSSPFQQIVREEIGTEKKLVLLAVGMAGKTHWSGTIEGDGMTEAIAMDFAARVSATPDFLGSTYVVDDAWKIETQSQSDSNNQSVVLKHKQLDVQLVLDSIGPHLVTIDGNRITLAFQAEFPANKRSQTLRWRYVLRNASSK